MSHYNGDLCPTTMYLVESTDEFPTVDITLFFSDADISSDSMEVDNKESALVNGDDLKPL